MDGMFIIFALLCFLAVMIFGVFFIVHMKLSPFHQYLYAKINKSFPRVGKLINLPKGKDCIVVINKENQMLFKAADLSISPYNNKLEAPYSYLKRFGNFFNMGGMRVIIILDRWGVTNDQKLNCDVYHTAKNKGIDDYDKMKRQIAFEKRALEGKEKIRVEYITEQDPKTGAALTDADGEAIQKEIYPDLFLSEKPFMQDAFKEIPFDQVYDYMDSVYPDEIDTYVDLEVGDYISKHVLSKNKGIFGR